MKYLEKLEREISSWPEVSSHPHRFGGRQFQYRSAEIGHAHTGGIIDIPFPRSIRDELLAEGLAEEHRWVPNSGWVTYHVRGEEDFNHAVWLMRLSYLRYTLKSARDPGRLLEEYAEKLQLTTRLKSLFEPLVPTSIAWEFVDTKRKTSGSAEVDRSRRENSRTAGDRPARSV